jgi:hypothetical protein
MKKTISGVLYGLLLSLGVLSFTSVSAHELLPKDLQEYIQDNPNASVEDIQNFINSQEDPELKEKYTNKEDIVNIVKNNNTSFFDNSFDFLKLGVEHILKGLDHILFVLSLLLVLVSLKEILKLTGTFTIAHSITLILAGSGFLTLSSKIVEPLIALSIAYVAISTVFLKHKPFFSSEKNKLISIFFFGLFHGLGFAGLLEEIALPQGRLVSSLIGFNIGIEVGQLLIVLVALPLLFLTKNKSWHERMVQVIAVIIALLGIFWAVQRTFF